MDNKKNHGIGMLALAIFWAALAALAWFCPAKEASDAERRTLAQMPEVTLESVLNGDFMEDFENYTLDQFPLRDTFRQLKALFHYNVLNQSDNNGIYIADGAAAQLEYPMNKESVDYAVERFARVYGKYLVDTDCRVYMGIVPDKGYYLAEENGFLAMDYERMSASFAEGMPWAVQIDLTDALSADCYYRTDTHWRQEKLLEAAGVICDAMGVAAPRAEDYSVTALERPFYGVYYGQAALPMDPETMYVLESRLLSSCVTSVGQWNTKESRGVFTKLYDGVYDLDKLAGKDLYEVYLSGSQSLIRIENPDTNTDRELIVFRDSFGSAIAPLLVQDYASVTLVDIRYMSPDLLGQFLKFTDQDVLFLYSTLVLNNSSTIK